MSALRIFPIGGMGNVTKNMFAYEYGNEILLVDCGIGFPESSMLGVDILIPDVTYLKKRVDEGATIVGMCLSHAHDDHIAALPYILPQLPEFPIYASELTAAFAKARMEEFSADAKVEVIRYGQSYSFGAFSVEFIHLTHSVPHTTHLAITTPEGIVYHGSDFKFDLNPVDGRLPDFGAIAEVGRRGVLCVLSDCLRVERKDWSPSESTLSESFEREITNCRGKFIVTLMSSNLHRIALLVETAIAHGRKLVFIGRSIEQNVEIAIRLNILSIPQKVLVHKKHMDQYKDSELCVVVAGSQGQPGSSLVRAVFGEHPILSVNQDDKVVFATEPIPGNERNVYESIDELARNGVDVAYSDMDKGLHVSGHAGATEQQLLIAMLKPAYLLPIGGTERHRAAYTELMHGMGYTKQRVLLPASGDVVSFDHGKASINQSVELKDMMVDGLGVGDVGEVVLNDRRIMAEEGIIVVVMPRKQGVIDTNGIQVMSRGFMFHAHAGEVLSVVKEETAKILADGGDDNEVRRKLERKLSRRMDDVIGRTPLILPIYVEG